MNKLMNMFFFFLQEMNEYVNVSNCEFFIFMVDCVMQLTIFFLSSLQCCLLVFFFFQLRIYVKKIKE